MASEQGGVSAAPLVFTATISEPPPLQSSTDTSVVNSTADPTRARSLKRPRPESTTYTTSLTSIANASLVGNPTSPKSPRSKGVYSPGYYAPPMTGAAAMEDARRREESQRSQPSAMSENPGHRVMSSLMAGGGVGISRPTDAPTATTSLSEGLSVAANAITVPTATQYEDKPLLSPVSSNGFGSLGTSAQTATASPTIVASPAAMTSADSELHSSSTNPGDSNLLQPSSNQDEQPSNRAFSFPGNLLAQTDAVRGPARGLSLPVPGQQLAPRSPSQKKHKCPYCDTEFTRHHNLKSHLLTHSQEKPYVCQTCAMRFRRLHDLKRHMKLHTGERPHVCPKCDRKFARGDALARHSKGQGGCAGRRASMGSFGGDEDFDGSNAGDVEEGMDGVLYSNRETNEGDMNEEERRRLSLPSIKAPHSQSGVGSSDSYTHSRQPSTYPPAGPRPGQHSGGLYPPGRDRAGSGSSVNSPSMQSNIIGGHSPNTSVSSIPISAGGSSMYSQGSMTESPKPLSPTAMQSHQLGHDHGSIHRQRSPSLTAQLQQQQFGRRPSGRGSPPFSLPSPHNSQGPKLPALSNLAPPDQRYTLQSQSQPSASGTSPSTMFQPPMSARPQASSQQHQVLVSNDNNLFAKGENGMLHYVSELEGQVKQLNEKLQIMESRERRHDQEMASLREELYALRSQVQQQHQPMPRLP